jgi:hypothetical protein
LSLETTQDATPAPSAVDSKTPHFNVSCQTCRISRTFVTLQGVNSFFGEHEGHKVIEGRLFERPQAARKPDPVAEEAPKPKAEEAPQVITQSGEVIAQELKPQAKEEPVAAKTEEAQPAPLQVVQPTDLQPKEPAAVSPALPSEKDIEEPLLLARSSYIGESEEKRTDALRVSRALKEFKWNVEPPYVIGIMVDDNLSVETNIGVISSSMVERVEKLGYKFVAVNAPQGSPVAWFKRDAQQAPETTFPVGDTEQMMQIRQGTRTYDTDKAVWQENFVSLLMTVMDMDGQKLKHVTNIIRSERPEPDLQS